MFSTPVKLGYTDSPESNLDYLFTLGEPELALYAKGYIQCSRHVQEALVEAKQKFLNAALTTSSPKILMNYVRLLDSVEDTLKIKVRTLEEHWPGDTEL